MGCRVVGCVGLMIFKTLRFGIQGVTDSRFCFSRLLDLGLWDWESSKIKGPYANPNRIVTLRYANYVQTIGSLCVGQ